MKYKVYIVKTDDVTNVATFIEADFNYGCGFDTIKEAIESIERHGSDYVNYTILPYIYMTD